MRSILVLLVGIFPTELNSCNTKPSGPVDGFVITGGTGGKPCCETARKKVELYNPSSGHSCSLPDLPQEMSLHTQCGLLLCGTRSCLMMDGTTFSRASVILREERRLHLCWSLPGTGGEVMLLGGSKSPTTTEVVSPDGSSSRTSWDLQYDTSGACGLELGDSLLVSGGFDVSNPEKSLSSVVKYQTDGTFQVLPELRVKRRGHACASFLSDLGETVVLVTGGYNALHFPHLDSTELMVDFSDWRPAANLPYGREYLSAASLDRKIFIFGGYHGKVFFDGKFINSILYYDTETDTWHPAGNLTTPRRRHAMALFPGVDRVCP